MLSLVFKALVFTTFASLAFANTDQSLSESLGPPQAERLRKMGARVGEIIAQFEYERRGGAYRALPAEKREMLLNEALAIIRLVPETTPNYSAKGITIHTLATAGFSAVALQMLPYAVAHESASGAGAGVAAAVVAISSAVSNFAHAFAEDGYFASRKKAQTRHASWQPFWNSVAEQLGKDLLPSMPLERNAWLEKKLRNAYQPLGEAASTEQCRILLDTEAALEEQVETEEQAPRRRARTL